MRYQYSAPVAARHEVNWDMRERPGIYDAGKRAFFSSAVLCELLRDWLDANAPGWSFRSDWDYSNGGDDDEGCHLTIASETEAIGFIQLADQISERWSAADRERMPYRTIIETVADGEAEFARSHHPIDHLQHERMLDRHLVLDRQPMRARIFRAIRTASLSMQESEEDQIRVYVDLESEEVRSPGTRVALLKIGMPAQDTA